MKTPSLPSMATIVLSLATTCAAGGQQVTVDLSLEHQVIDNFGASDCWRFQKIGAWSEESKNRVADLLFSQTEGIGLSCWRTSLHGS